MKDILVIFFIASMVMLSCTPSKWSKKTGKQVAEGWIDEHTCIIKSQGCPDSNLKGIEERKKNCRKMAGLNVLEKFLDKFGEYPFLGAGADSHVLSKSIKDHKLKMLKKHGKALKNRHVIKEEFEKDFCCVIYYKIASPDLKHDATKME